jgi:hypothetical protein
MAGNIYPNRDKGERTWRLAPFSAPAGSGQTNSNGANTSGKPRQNACLQCLIGLRLATVDKEHGRGVTNCNEVFRFVPLAALSLFTSESPLSRSC